MSGRHEVPDPDPVALPIGFTHPPSMVDLIRMHIRREMSQLAQSNDAETFDEADDFEVEDDVVDPHTPYEAVFDPPADDKEDREPGLPAAGGGGAESGKAPPSEANGAPGTGGEPPKAAEASKQI